jgi:hypothetical protein
LCLQFFVDRTTYSFIPHSHLDKGLRSDLLTQSVVHKPVRKSCRVLHKGLIAKLSMNWLRTPLKNRYSIIETRIMLSNAARWPEPNAGWRDGMCVEAYFPDSYRD